MKIIDNKGRLFGKINLIDFLFVAVIFFILPVFYFGHKVFSNSRLRVSKKEFVSLPVIPPHIITIEHVFLFKGIDMDIKDKIKPGVPVGHDKDGNVTAVIIKVGDIVPAFFEYDLGAPYKLLQINPENCDVYVTLKIALEEKSMQLFYNGQRIQLNIPFDLTVDEKKVQVTPLADK